MFAGNTFLGIISFLMLVVNTGLFMATFFDDITGFTDRDVDGHQTLSTMRMLFLMNAFACLPGAFS